MSSPLVDWAQRLPGKLDQFANRVGAPIQQGVQKVEGLFGMHPQPNTQYMAPVQDVQKANDSFKKPQGVLTQAARHK